MFEHGGQAVRYVLLLLGGARQLHRLRGFRAMTIFPDVPFRDYLALPGAHFTSLAHMAKSPLHYRRACDRERDDTPALRLGRLTHALILTPELPPDVALFDGKVRRGQYWNAFRDEHEAAGRLVVRDGELDAAKRMRDAVYSNRVARDLLGDGRGEVTVTWEEPIEPPARWDGTMVHGVRCRARLDWLGSRGVVELKTTRHTTLHSWAREVAARSYHVQHAHYRAGVVANGVEPGENWWVVIESSEPHDVVTYRLRQSDLEAGERVRQGWLQRVVECEASGRWPGVGGDEAIEFQLPEYAMTEGLEDVDMSGVTEAME